MFIINKPARRIMTVLLPQSIDRYWPLFQNFIWAHFLLRKKPGFAGVPSRHCVPRLLAPTGRHPSNPLRGSRQPPSGVSGLQAWSFAAQNSGSSYATAPPASRRKHDPSAVFCLATHPCRKGHSNSTQKHPTPIQLINLTKPNTSNRNQRPEANRKENSIHPPIRPRKKMRPNKGY
jgi:hypothetical protein